MSELSECGLGTQYNCISPNDIDRPSHPECILEECIHINSERYLEDLAARIFEPLVRYESAFIRWFPGNGKTILLQHIFSSKRLLSKYFGNRSQRIHVIHIKNYIFSGEEINDYFQNVYEECCEIFLKNHLSFYRKSSKNLPSKSLIYTLKRIIEVCRKVADLGYEIVFVVDSVDDLSGDIARRIFIAWEQIIEGNRLKFHIHINAVRRSILRDYITQPLLIQNIITVPLPDRRECNHFINYYLNRWNIRLDEDSMFNIFGACGNDPSLIKEVLRLYRLHPARVTQYATEQTLLLKAKINFSYFDEQEKAVIENMVKKNRISPFQKTIADELVHLNFWNYRYESPGLIETVILNHDHGSEFSFNRNENSIVFNGIILKNKLTAAEYSILKLLYKKKKEVTGRDEIAECLWRGKSLDNYSDWAIDKVISRLRRKLARLGFSHYIKTRKRYGFSLEIDRKK